MIYSLFNINDFFKKSNPVIKSRVYGNNTINKYKLHKSIKIKLSNGYDIIIPKGFIWDLASSNQAIAIPNFNITIKQILQD